MNGPIKLTRAQMASCAESFHQMLMAIDAGELAAAPAMRHRLEGAWVALRMVAEGRAPDVTEMLTRPAQDTSTGT